MILSEPSYGKPSIIIWWIVYCFLGAGLYALSTVSHFLGPASPQRPGEYVVTLAILVVVTLLYGIGPFLPRSQAAWVFGFVQMAVSLLCSCGFCLPVVIPLFIFWLRPACRDWFTGRTEPEDFAEVFE